FVVLIFNWHQKSNPQINTISDQRRQGWAN
ncbi:unnamed protein product, partial [Onchocerca ochengi]